MDDFEQQLKRQPPRTIPPEWRRDILNAARQQRSVGNAQPVAWQWLREWLWPAPQAWAGLAAVWVAILALQFVPEQGFENVVAQAASAARLTPEVKLALAEQQRLRTELLELAPNPPPPAEPPRPRSERRSPTFTAIA
mgnify:FL=1